MKGRYEVCLAGEGGQGLALAGLVLAEAVVYGGKNVVTTQSVGAGQRGGISQTSIIISDGEIDYPKVLEADLFVALTQDAFDRYRSDVARGGLIIVDSSCVEAKEADGLDIIPIPLREIALKALGEATATNLLALGVITELTRAVSRTAIRDAVKRNLPPKSLGLNKKALEKGFEVGRAIRAERRAKPV